MNWWFNSIITGSYGHLPDRPRSRAIHSLMMLFVLLSFRTSLVTWLISNILLCFILSRGMLMLTLTGCLMIIASFVYHFMQPFIPLDIPFSDGFLRFHYGWCFWLCLSAGTFIYIDSLAAVTLIHSSTLQPRGYYLSHAVFRLKNHLFWLTYPQEPNAGFQDLQDFDSVLKPFTIFAYDLTLSDQWLMPFK